MPIVLVVSLAMALTGGSLARAAEAGPRSWSPDPITYGVRVTNDVPVTMSDGRVLRARIHEPADLATGAPAAGPFPVVLWLTPYGKSASVPIDDGLVQRGYLGVAVDVAGTGGSDGASQLFGPVEAADSVEIVDWAAALPRSNGRVGMSGGSYLAIDQMFAAAAVGPGSPLKAIFPIAVAADPYRDLFVSGGVINLESPTGLLAAYAGVRTLTPLAERGSADPIDALRLVTEHGVQAVPFEGRTLLDTVLDGDRRYDGPYWSSRAPINVVDQIVANDVAVYLVGGDYDVFQRGEPLLYAALQNAAAGRPVTAPMVPGQAVDTRFQLLFGPWNHGNQGQGADLLRRQLQWFDHWLKGRDTGITRTATPLHVIEPNGHRYSTATYPVAGASAVRFHLAPGGRLTTSAPAAAAGDVLPFTGLGNNPCGLSVHQWSAGLVPADVCGPQRRPADPVPTELAYTTDPVAADTTIAGPIGLTLFARATTSETLWTARLEDVAPDGSATEMTGGALLGSMRALDPARSWPSGDGGWLVPHLRLTRAARAAVVPGQRTRYDLEIRPAFATIPAGHRLRLVIGTSDAPHLTPTPQEGLNLIGGVYTIDHSATEPSYLEIPIRR